MKSRADKNSTTAAVAGFQGPMGNIPLPEGVTLRSAEEHAAAAGEAIKAFDADQVKRLEAYNAAIKELGLLTKGMAADVAAPLSVLQAHWEAVDVSTKDATARTEAFIASGMLRAASTVSVGARHLHHRHVHDGQRSRRLAKERRRTGRAWVNRQDHSETTSRSSRPRASAAASTVDRRTPPRSRAARR